MKSIGKFCNNHPAVTLLCEIAILIGLSAGAAALFSVASEPEPKIVWADSKWFLSIDKEEETRVEFGFGLDGRLYWRPEEAPVKNAGEEE